MGTNYYWQSDEGRCAHCGRSDQEEIHIGKSSAGWCFSLHVDPGLGINDLPDWIERWKRKESRIRDEYGKSVTAEEMWAVVMCRMGKSQDEDDWYSRNHAKRGPFGLARSMFRASPGEGPYDLCIGEFS